MYRLKSIGEPLPADISFAPTYRHKADAITAFSNIALRTDLRGANTKLLLSRYCETISEFDFADASASAEAAISILHQLLDRNLESRSRSGLGAKELRQLAGPRKITLSHRTAEFAVELGDGSLQKGIRQVFSRLSANEHADIGSAPRHKLREVAVNLTPEAVDWAYCLGNGNISAGVRNAIYFVLTRHNPNPTTSRLAD